MLDDIVTRLRGMGSLTCYWCQEHVCEGEDEDCCSTFPDRDNCHDRKQTITDAADEIERLRGFVLSLPCTCWINQPPCVRCQVQGLRDES